MAPTPDIPGWKLEAGPVRGERLGSDEMWEAFQAWCARHKTTTGRRLRQHMADDLLSEERH